MEREGIVGSTVETSLRGGRSQKRSEVFGEIHDTHHWFTMINTISAQQNCSDPRINRRTDTPSHVDAHLQFNSGILINLLTSVSNIFQNRFINRTIIFLNLA